MVTGKRVNRGCGYGLEVPCQYSFKGNSLAVKWLSERIAKERKIVEDALARNQERKPAARGGSKGITVGKAVVQQRKHENNCFRLQYNSVVISKLFFQWNND